MKSALALINNIRKKDRPKRNGYIFGVHRTTNTEMHVVLFNTIDVYTAILKLNWLSVAWVAQLIEHVNIAHLYF